MHKRPLTKFTPEHDRNSQQLGVSRREHAQADKWCLQKKIPQLTPYLMVKY